MYPRGIHLSSHSQSMKQQRYSVLGCSGIWNRANRVDARIVNSREKQVISLEMSCPWVSNRDKKTFDKTVKYAPLRWELKQRYPGYEINQCNIILDVLGGWSKDLDVTLQKLVGSKAKGVL